MLSGPWLGVDVGSVRIGIAATDAACTMAFPVSTVVRGDDAVAEVAALVAEREATTVIVGWPRSLSGGHSASTADAEAFAQSLAEHTAAGVRLMDERLSTVTATHHMRQAGRSARQQRSVIDQAAAVVILDSALNGARLGNLDTVTVIVHGKGNDDKPA